MGAIRDTENELLSRIATLIPKPKTDRKPFLRPYDLPDKRRDEVISFPSSGGIRKFLKGGLCVME